MTHFGGYGAHSQFKIAIFLLLITFNSLILCQYTCAFCNNAGTLSYFFKLVISITLGCLIVMAASNFLLPWYSSTTALQLLALAYRNSASLLCQYYDYLYNISTIEDLYENDPVEAARRKAEVPFPTGALQERVVRLLGAVEVILAREAVIWKHGVYTFPPVVSRMLAALTMLQHRLTILEVVCQQEASLDRFTSTQHRVFMGPLHQHTQQLEKDVIEVARLTGDILCSSTYSGPDAALLTSKIALLEAHRLECRQIYLQRRKELHSMVRALPDRHFSEIVSYDDTWRYLSWLFGFLQSLDVFELSAKTVLQEGCSARDDWSAWTK
eukprot:jgi/Botrbrau1/6788/Bobra.0057s0023.2